MLRDGDFYSFDGTRLRTYEGGIAHGQPLIIANGLGGSIRSWRHIVSAFGARFRILSWDYRGLYGSDWPADRRSFELTHHAHDLAALLEHFDVHNPVIMGWSMGVQVMLEFHRTHADVPAALVAIHGTHSSPLHTAFDGRTPRRVAPAVYRVVRRGWRVAMRPAKRLSHSRRLTGLFVRGGIALRVMDPAIDRSVFWDMGRDWVHLDLDNYCSLFEALDRHDARGLLPLVKAPMLVVNGERDRFTPPQYGEEIAAGVQRSELFVIPGGTHFGLLEYPDALNRRLARFFGDHLFDPA